MIAMLSYALDFIVYCVVNRFFWEETVRLFSCTRVTNNKVKDATTSVANENAGNCSEGQGRARRLAWQETSVATKEVEFRSEQSLKRF